MVELLNYIKGLPERNIAIVTHFGFINNFVNTCFSDSVSTNLETRIGYLDLKESSFLGFRVEEKCFWSSSGCTTFSVLGTETVGRTSFTRLTFQTVAGLL